MKKIKILTLSVIILLMFFTTGYTDLSERAFSFSSLLKKSDFIVAGMVIDVKIGPDKYIMTFKVDEYITGNDAEYINILVPMNNGFYIPDEAYIEKGRKALLFLFKKNDSIFITNRYGGYLKIEMKEDVKKIFQKYNTKEKLFSENYKNDLKYLFSSCTNIEIKKRLLYDIKNVLSFDDNLFLSSLLLLDNEEFKTFAILQAGRKKVKSLHNTIRDLLIKSNNLNVKFYSLVALGDYGYKENVDLIIDCLKNEREDLKVAAVESLGKIGDLLIVEPLKSLYLNENDIGIKMRIICSIVRMKNVNTAISELRYIESSEKDSFLKSFINNKIEYLKKN